MLKQYFISAWSQIKQYKLISAITIGATALSIFLIMLVVMLEQVKTAPFTPESNRDRFLHAKFFSISNSSWGDATSNGPMSKQSADALWKSLETPEAVTAYVVFAVPMPVAVPEQPIYTADVREADADYWKVFDFRFIEGKPFDEAMVDSKRPVVVLSESIARQLFGTSIDVVGKEVRINYVPMSVVGVVKDVSTLATNAYGQAWIPLGLTENSKESWNHNIMGNISVTILAKKRSDFTIIREETNRKLMEYNQLLSESGYNVINRNRPYDQEKESVASGGRYEPDVNQARKQRIIIFLILLIIPAVNLSSMTQSRLRQRITEIGIRRAFGCTRSEILNQIIIENFIITLFAGIIGLLLSIGFAWIGADMLFKQPYSMTLNAPTIDASILIHPSTFVYALLFCFVLNLLSSGLPALRASRTCIVNALNRK